MRLFLFFLFVFLPDRPPLKKRFYKHHSHLYLFSSSFCEITAEIYLLCQKRLKLRLENCACFMFKIGFLLHVAVYYCTPSLLMEYACVTSCDPFCAASDRVILGCFTHFVTFPGSCASQHFLILTWARVTWCDVKQEVVLSLLAHCFGFLQTGKQTLLFMKLDCSHSRQLIPLNDLWSSSGLRIFWGAEMENIKKAPAVYRKLLYIIVK